MDRGPTWVTLEPEVEAMGLEVGMEMLDIRVGIKRLDMMVVMGLARLDMT